MANTSSVLLRFWNDNKCQFSKMAAIARQLLSKVLVSSTSSIAYVFSVCLLKDDANDSNIV